MNEFGLHWIKHSNNTTDLCSWLWRLKLTAARWNAYFSNRYTNYNAKTLARFGLQSVPKIKQVVEIND